MHPSQRPRGEPQPRVEREPWLALRVSLHSGRAPLSGVASARFKWADVLSDPFPRPEECEPAAYCVPVAETQAGAFRVENVLLVVPKADGRAEVVDRLFVSGRVLGAAIEAERAGVGAVVEEKREQAQAAARRADDPFASGIAHALAATLGAVRRVTRGLTTMPDRVAVRWDRSRRFLATPEGRAKFRKGLFDPHGLSAEEKAVTLFVGTASLLAALVLAHVAVTLSVPSFAGDWRAMVFLFLYAYVSSLGIPFPIEPMLFPAALVLGKPAALVTTVVAKVCAGWMVFFVGDSVNHQLRRKAERSERWARFLDWSERFARRFGVGALAVFIATPGLPDIVALYVFGALHMRLPQFLVGVAIGSTILNGIILYGVGHLLGI